MVLLLPPPMVAAAAAAMDYLLTWVYLMVDLR
jgi:hypothetical protein